MHRLDEPLKTVHEHGPMKLELLLNRFLLSIGFPPSRGETYPLAIARGAIHHLEAAHFYVVLRGDGYVHAGFDSRDAAIKFRMIGRESNGAGSPIAA